MGEDVDLTAEQCLAVVKHRANVPCTNVPALTRAPVLYPGGLVQPTSDIRAGDFEN